MAEGLDSAIPVSLIKIHVRSASFSHSSCRRRTSRLILKDLPVQENNIDILLPCHPNPNPEASRRLERKNLPVSRACLQAACRSGLGLTMRIVPLVFMGNGTYSHPMVEGSALAVICSCPGERHREGHRKAVAPARLDSSLRSGRDAS